MSELRANTSADDFLGGGIINGQQLLQSKSLNTE